VAVLFEFLPHQESLVFVRLEDEDLRHGDSSFLLYLLGRLPDALRS
jgi:hypothetical protein